MIPNQLYIRVVLAILFSLVQRSRQHGFLRPFRYEFAGLPFFRIPLGPIFGDGLRGACKIQNKINDNIVKHTDKRIITEDDEAIVIFDKYE